MLDQIMLRALHPWYRKDPWVKALYAAIDADMESTNEKLDQDYNNIFFDRLDENGCSVLEKDLGLKPGKDATLDARRKNIQSTWLAKRFASMTVIQQICDGIYKGDCKAEYDGDATITYAFRHYLDPAPYTGDLVEAVDQIKPAHIDYKFRYDYNVWRDYYYPLFWSNVKEKTWTTEAGMIWSDNYALRHNWSYMKTRTWKDSMIKDVE
ncbi:MAG: hypothetical protein SOU94_07085 [Acidaminococcus sp.]|uniref:putative phage tail protein n=1 Tax=Acidaminococcus sp. TaxID=1872103 RepID=UPI002A74787B|nr:putative phage tail protein [Acidaminococcus sp.]MDY2739577.1 hypothetical protein [Acidaminococcus sp.]